MNLLVSEKIYHWPLRPCGYHTLTYNSQHLSHVYGDHGLINYTHYLKSEFRFEQLAKEVNILYKYNDGLRRCHDGNQSLSRYLG